MEISGGAVVGLAATGVTSIVGYLIRERLESIVRAQKLLFDKCDENRDALAEFKLDAAKSYVNQASLKEALAPIYKSLEQLHEDLKEGRK